VSGLLGEQLNRDLRLNRENRLKVGVVSLGMFRQLGRPARLMPPRDRRIRAAVYLLGMATQIVPHSASSGWDWIDGRTDIPGVVGLVRATGEPRAVGPGAADEVSAWIDRVGWLPDFLPPVTLVPAAG
jgi:hypothetical protein